MTYANAGTNKGAVIIDPARRARMMREPVRALRDVAARIIADARREDRYAGQVNTSAGLAHVIKPVEGGDRFLVMVNYAE